MSQKEEGFDLVEPALVDVKSLENIKQGVPNFWLNAMLNHP